MELRHNAISERLEIDLDVMVKHEVVSAYREVQVPCIVEHAGLVFDDFKDPPFPGGLTKPMWKALHQDFVGTFRLRSYGATAKAVVGYCDGMVVRTFSGVTHGQLVREGPRGSRQFYWDTIFIPDDPDRPGSNLTYAEIADERDLGVRHKVVKLSQSTKAMLGCLTYIREQKASLLWP